MARVDVHRQGQARRWGVVECAGVPQVRAVEQDHRPRRCDDLHLIGMRAHSASITLEVDRRPAEPVRAGYDPKRAAVAGKRRHAPHRRQRLPWPFGPALAVVLMQALLARSGDGRPQVERVHVPGIAKHRRRRIGEQGMPMTRGKAGVGRVKVGDDAPFGGVQAGLVGPRGNRLADQFLQPVPDGREHGLVQQRPYNQVTLVPKEPALSRAEPCLGGHGYDTSAASAASQRNFLGFQSRRRTWSDRLGTVTRSPGLTTVTSWAGITGTAVSRTLAHSTP